MTTSFPEFGFGSGSLYGVRTDISNPTPVQFGTLQEASVDMSFTVKELQGQYQAPVSVARAGQKITGKIKNATIVARNFNDIFFGQTLGSASVLRTVVNEGAPNGTAIPTTPFQITTANGATQVSNLGVVNAATGVQFQRVASSPTAGQYSVVESTGVYTFASADNVSAIKVLISYTYTDTSVTTSGRITAANQLMGAAPVFKLVLGESYNGNGLSLVLYQCIATKLSMTFKNEDFMIPELDFSAFANSAGNYFDWNSDQ